jgi:hypothetical protein
MYICRCTLYVSYTHMYMYMYLLDDGIIVLISDSFLWPFGGGGGAAVFIGMHCKTFYRSRHSNAS